VRLEEYVPAICQAAGLSGLVESDWKNAEHPKLRVMAGVSRPGDRKGEGLIALH